MSIAASRRRSHPPERARTGSAAIAHYVESTPLTGKDFLAGYRSLRSEYKLGAMPHHPQAIVEAAALLREVPRISMAGLTGLLGGNSPAVVAARAKILTLLGRSKRSSARAPSPTAVQDLRAWLADRIGPLPDTAWGPPPSLPYAEPPSQHCRRILALRDPGVRLTAGLVLLIIWADHNTQITPEICAWETLDQIYAAAIGDAPSSVERQCSPERIAALLRAWLIEDPTPRRLNMWRTLTRSSKRVDRYCQAHPVIGAKLLADRVMIPSPPKSLVAPIRRTMKVARRCRRAATADPIADDWPGYRRRADRCVAQVAGIREAFDACCERQGHTPGKTAPGRFTVTIASGEREEASYSLSFRVWSATDIERRLRVSPRRPSTRAGVPFHLEWMGAGEDGGDDALLAILSCYRVGLFVDTRHRTPEQDRAVLELCRPAGWFPDGPPLRLFRYHAHHDRVIAERAWRQGIVLIPIAMLHYAVMIGRALFANGLSHGARLSETLQQHRSSDCFDETPEGLVYFEAFTKAHADRERFYCDEDAVEAIAALLRVARRNGWPLTTVRPPYPFRDRCSPARYIFQFDGALISPAIANACLRMLFFPHYLASHDLRHGFAKIAEPVGGRPRVQAALHHRSPSVTAGYSTPTERAQRELALKLASLRGLAFEGRLGGGG